MRINKEQLGDSYGWLDYSLRRFLMSKATSITLKNWPLLLIGWRKSFGRVEKITISLNQKMKSLFTSSSNFNIQTSRWPFTSSTKTKTTDIYSSQPHMTSMSQLRNSSMKSEKFTSNIKSILQASRSHFRPKKLSNK